MSGMFWIELELVEGKGRSGSKKALGREVTSKLLRVTCAMRSSDAVILTALVLRLGHDLWSMTTLNAQDHTRLRIYTYSHGLQQDPSTQKIQRYPKWIFRGSISHHFTTLSVENCWDLEPLGTEADRPSVSWIPGLWLWHTASTAGVDAVSRRLLNLHVLVWPKNCHTCDWWPAYKTVMAGSSFNDPTSTG